LIIKQFEIYSIQRKKRKKTLSRIRMYNNADFKYHVLIKKS